MSAFIPFFVLVLLNAVVHTRRTMVAARNRQKGLDNLPSSRLDRLPAFLEVLTSIAFLYGLLYAITTPD
jgi:hypothetical protein